jgi:hypothetical protein
MRNKRSRRWSGWRNWRVCAAILSTARERLYEVWELAERGPYPLFHTDVYNILAHIERDAGTAQAAISVATEAYRRAWYDGEPYAYGSIN